MVAIGSHLTIIVGTRVPAAHSEEKPSLSFGDASLHVSVPSQGDLDCAPRREMLERLLLRAPYWLACGGQAVCSFTLRFHRHHITSFLARSSWQWGFLVFTLHSLSTPVS